MSILKIEQCRLMLFSINDFKRTKGCGYFHSESRGLTIKWHPLYSPRAFFLSALNKSHLVQCVRKVSASQHVLLTLLLHIPGRVLHLHRFYNFCVSICESWICFMSMHVLRTPITEILKFLKVVFIHRKEENYFIHSPHI